MNTYRCNHDVEALRWMGTDEDRARFAAWFESHNVAFETRGSAVVLPTHVTAFVGEWILYLCSDGVFRVMDDAGFTANYARQGDEQEARASTISISRRQLFELLVNALRYAIDRSTYVTDEVASAIREHWSALSLQERQVIYRDVCKGVADEVADAKTVWQPLKQWIEAVP